MNLLTTTTTAHDAKIMAAIKISQVLLVQFILNLICMEDSKLNLDEEAELWNRNVLLVNLQNLFVKSLDVARLNYPLFITVGYKGSLLST
ncbi:unnamed protein product [Rhizophagus irregularis]|nr:unnamed protein product [Rhizophagus irregularis]